MKKCLLEVPTTFKNIKKVSFDDLTNANTLGQCFRKWRALRLEGKVFYVSRENVKDNF